MQTEQLPAIEGILPGYLWIFLFVLVALAGIAVLGDKVFEIVYKWNKRKKEKTGEAAEGPVNELKGELAAIRGEIDGVKKTQGEMMGKIDRINEKLANDNARIITIEGEQADIHNGFSALATAILAMLEHEMHNGNTEQMENAKDQLIQYLTKR